LFFIRLRDRNSCVWEHKPHEDGDRQKICSALASWLINSPAPRPCALLVHRFQCSFD
jgi:hypothetical protein